jgi:hypothetical protein
MEHRSYSFGRSAGQNVVVVTRPFSLPDNPRHVYQPGERLMLDRETLAGIVENGCGEYVSRNARQ